MKPIQETIRYFILIALTALAVWLLLLPKMRAKPKVQVVQQVITQRETLTVQDPALAKQVEYWRGRALAPTNIPTTQEKIIRDTLTIALIEKTPVTIRLDIRRDYLIAYTVQDSLIQIHRARLNSPTGTVLITPLGVSLTHTRPIVAPFVSIALLGNLGKPLNSTAEAWLGLKLRWARLQLRAGVLGSVPEMMARWKGEVEWEF